MEDKEQENNPYPSRLRGRGVEVSKTLFYRKAECALQKMEEKNYASDLIASGIARNNIYEIAFAFDGKEVLVKERHVTASDDEV